MRKLSISEFVRTAWQEALVQQVENMNLPKHAAIVEIKSRSAGRWASQLNMMRAFWAVGESTTFISPLREDVRRLKIVVVFDDIFGVPENE